MSRIALAVLALGMLVPGASAQTEAKLKTFFRDGGWSGEIQALRWGGLDSPKASAVGRHSRATATEACAEREGRQRGKCISQLMAEPEVRIFADCSAGVTWRDDGRWKFRLSEDAKAGKLRPLDDETAWTEKALSHRTRFTAVSWLAFLCPASSKAWRIEETQ